MSIDRIQEAIKENKYHSDLDNTPNADSKGMTTNEYRHFLDSERRLLVAIGEHLIEREEQKENELRQIVMKAHNDAFKESYNKHNDPVVEVGQIWRSQTDKDDVTVEVTHVKTDNCCKTVVYYSYGDELPDGYCYINTLVENYELVTMDNIKEDEWVECVETKQYSNIVFGEKGKKYQVGKKLIAFIKLKVNGINVHVADKRFVPCLPPVEKEEKKYTQEDIDKAREEGRQEMRYKFMKAHDDLHREKANILMQFGCNYDLIHGYELCMKKIFDNWNKV